MRSIFSPVFNGAGGAGGADGVGSSMFGLVPCGWVNEACGWREASRRTAPSYRSAGAGPRPERRRPAFRREEGLAGNAGVGRNRVFRPNRPTSPVPLPSSRNRPRRPPVRVRRRFPPVAARGRRRAVPACAAFPCRPPGRGWRDRDATPPGATHATPRKRALARAKKRPLPATGRGLKHSVRPPSGDLRAVLRYAQLNMTREPTTNKP